MSISSLTDPSFIRKLETLSLLSKKVLGGELKADRKTTKRGSGTTFADYTEYNFGDDFRNIDWNIYARLENMVIKLFELEEDVRIFILLDISPSMKKKLLQAKKIAAALSYIALNHLDHLTIYGISDDLKTIVKPSHGRNRIFPMLEALENVECHGYDTNFRESLKTFYMRHRRPGICVVISDFFVPNGYSRTLEHLMWNRHDVFCIQLQHPAEQHCSMRGDIEFKCIESGATKQVTVGPREAARFAAAMQQWNADLQQNCAKQGIGLATASTEVPFEKIIQHILLRGGLVA
jgi:uncharacterized protein (DUF58 family)